MVSGRDRNVPGLQIEASRCTALSTSRNRVAVLSPCSDRRREPRGGSQNGPDHSRRSNYLYLRYTLPSEYRYLGANWSEASQAGCRSAANHFSALSVRAAPKKQRLTACAWTVLGSVGAPPQRYDVSECIRTIGSIQSTGRMLLLLRKETLAPQAYASSVVVIETVLSGR